MTKQLKEIEIPFGAKDSELCDWEYTIPEGMEATIVDNRIVVKKKESGDEKIRKELIQYLKECTNLPSGQYCRADFFDWLEKQGESIDREKVLIGARKDVALSIINYLDNNSVGMCLSNMECEDIEDACVNSKWTKLYNYMKKKLEKQGEQKPVLDNALKEAFDKSRKDYSLEEKKEASDYSESIIPTSIAYGESEEEYMLHKIIEAAFIAGQNTKQKPAWSEEDEYLYGGVIETELYMLDVVNGVEKFDVGNNSIKEECTKELNWLKSLKDRVQPQPKQEWSKEDEERYRKIVRYIKSKGYEDDSDWLKSLKDRFCPQNAWRPSEEQIKVCKEVYADLLSAKGFNVGTINSELNRLEEQLKKLKG